LAATNGKESQDLKEVEVAQEADASARKSGLQNNEEDIHN